MSESYELQAYKGENTNNYNNNNNNTCKKVFSTKKHLKRLAHKSHFIPINVPYLKTVMQQQRNLHGLESVISTSDTVFKAEPDSDKENTPNTCYFNLPFQPVSVVIQSENAGGRLSRRQQEFVKNELWKAINMTHDSPRFERMTIENDILKITCSDAVSLLWLSKSIWVMPPYENTKFILHIGDGLNTLMKANMWIPEQNRKPREVLRMLRAQNRGLDTSRWKIFSTYHSGSGLNIEMAIDQDSFDFLKSECGFRPYFFLTRVFINVLGK